MSSLQQTKSPTRSRSIAGREREQLEGWIPDRWRQTTEVRDALEKAFDYRGDVTLTRKDGTEGCRGTCLIGKHGCVGSSDSFVRIIPTARSGGKVTHGLTPT